jgi:hypothetical protein
MSADMQKRFKQECQDRGIWAGGKVATHQDLSGYFFSRCVELYLRSGGLIAFVMPYAAMNRKQFEGFRTGKWEVKVGRIVVSRIECRFEEAWMFDEHVQPLFPVPSCVLFARSTNAGRLPATVARFRGKLPSRNPPPDAAESALASATAPWPAAPKMEGGSAYRERFSQGANMVPRMLAVVESVAATGVGTNAATPLVRSRKNNQEKEPWRSLPPLQMTLEREALRQLYLGESVAPYRMLDPVLSMIPWDGAKLLDSAGAGLAGMPGLSLWLAQAEGLWTKHRSPTTTISLLEQFNYYQKLSGQFPIAPLRVLYSKAGSLPAAAVLRSGSAVVDHKAYWSAVASEGEAYYLVAVLNSETARQRVEHFQSRGQWGARDFDKVLFELPIPEFDATSALQRELADAAGVAETVASGVDISGMGFVRARGKIREALREDGIAGQIDELVAQLLDG